MINWIKVEDELPELAPVQEGSFKTPCVRVLTWGLYIKADVSVLFFGGKLGFCTTYFYEIYENDEEMAEQMSKAWKENITHWSYINKPE